MQLEPQQCIQDFFKSIYHTPAQEIKERRSTSYIVNIAKAIHLTLDSHGGCLITIPSGAEIPSNFQASFESLSKNLANSGKINSIWFNFFHPYSARILSLIPSDWIFDGDKKGNQIHDTQVKCTRVWQWINPSKECNIPPGATHNIGASALIVDDLADKVLLVQDSHRRDSWGISGGSFDPKLDSIETTMLTAIRECKEECDVDVSFVKGELVAQMHFPFNQFAPGINQIWRFRVDHTQYPPQPQSGEILRAAWISFDDVRKGQFEGIKIGPEILEMISAKLGFRLSDKSNQWMKLYTNPSLPVIRIEDD